MHTFEIERIKDRLSFRKDRYGQPLPETVAWQPLRKCNYIYNYSGNLWTCDGKTVERHDIARALCVEASLILDWEQATGLCHKIDVADDTYGSSA